MPERKLKLYDIDFPLVWPVGGCLIVAAYDKRQARKIAKATIVHTDQIDAIKEVKLDGPKVIKYLSGDY